MVLSEAMQYGLPVVTCAVGAVPETVRNASVLVQADDPVAFASALRHLLAQPEEYARHIGLSRQNAARLPTWEDTAQIFASVVSGLSSRSAT